MFLTLAELGAVVYDGTLCADIPPDEILRPTDIPAFEVDLIDSTGAEDTSMAGFTYEYLRTNDIVKSACFAGFTSSIMIENVGPNFEMTEQMVSARAGKLLEKIESGSELESGERKRNKE